MRLVRFRVLLHGENLLLSRVSAAGPGTSIGQVPRGALPALRPARPLHRYGHRVDMPDLRMVSGLTRPADRAAHAARFANQVEARVDRRTRRRTVRWVKGDHEIDKSGLNEKAPGPVPGCFVEVISRPDAWPAPASAGLFVCFAPGRNDNRRSAGVVAVSWLAAVYPALA